MPSRKFIRRQAPSGTGRSRKGEGKKPPPFFCTWQFFVLATISCVCITCWRLHGQLTEIEHDYSQTIRGFGWPSRAIVEEPVEIQSLETPAPVEVHDSRSASPALPAQTQKPASGFLSLGKTSSTDIVPIVRQPVEATTEVPRPKQAAQAPVLALTGSTLALTGSTPFMQAFGRLSERRCKWTPHGRKFLGEYAKHVDSPFATIEDGMTKCEQLGPECAGVTCDAKSCSVREGKPYLALANGEDSFIKACPGETTQAPFIVPDPSQLDTPAGEPGSLEEQDRRAELVRGAMRHAWSSYRKNAWGMDNLMPISGRGQESSFHHAVTMIDSLDTLWLMGMKEEFADAKAWCEQHMKERIAHIGGGTSIFETTIRTLGGLASAYALSKEKVFLDLATQLAEKVIERTDGTGITPYTFSGANGGMGCRSLAESGTMQVEMRYISRATGDMRFEEKVFKFYDYLRGKPNLDGLYPNCFQQSIGKITFGADGDSFYEYLLKVWMQGGRKEGYLWDMYNAAVDGLEKHVASKGPDGLTYLAILNWHGGTSFSREESMEHLTCFVAGWLAQGSLYQTDPDRKRRHLDLADQVGTTCWHMYDEQPTKIAPERVKGMRMDLKLTDTKEYILRPEAIEGWYHLYQRTGDQKYREWGWKTFLAFERELKTEYGYASLRDVSARGRSGSGKYFDRMESFFLAETLKYAFLLQEPSDMLPANKWVFNTEAHPMPII